MDRHHFSRHCRDGLGQVQCYLSCLRMLLYTAIRRVVSLLDVPPGRLSELVPMAEKMKFETHEDGDRVLTFVDDGGDKLEVAIDDAYDMFMILTINAESVGLSHEQALQLVAAISSEIARRTCRKS